MFIVTGGGATTRELAVGCFFAFRRSIDDFYQLLSGRDLLMDYNMEVSQHFSVASKSVRELMDAASWRLWETHRASREARTSLASVHERLVGLEAELISYSNEKDRSLRELVKQRETAPLRDYFAEMADPGVTLAPSLGAALAFFESELQLYGNIRSLLLASLVGAVVGSLLTGALGLLVR